MSTKILSTSVNKALNTLDDSSIKFYTSHVNVFAFFIKTVNLTANLNTSDYVKDFLYHTEMILCQTHNTEKQIAQLEKFMN